MESEPIAAIEALEQLARIDSAASWNLQISAGIDIILQWFPDEALDEVLGGGEETIVAGSFHPPGQAMAKDGGYEHRATPMVPIEGP